MSAGEALSLVALLFAASVSAWGQGQPTRPSSPSRLELAAGTSRIAGRIVNAKGGTPLERARVWIESVENPQQSSKTLVTAADGRFFFDLLAPGKYSLHGAKRGFLDGTYDQHEQFSTAIVTGAGLDTKNLTLRLTPTAIISVKVIDEAGEPIRNARVSVFRDINRSGQGRTVPMGGLPTNDLGVFEITAVPPGNYFISASATPWYAVHPSSTSGGGAAAAPPSVDRNLDVAYPTTFYANATDADDATPIPVKGGDRIDVDIHLSPVPAMHLLFRQPPGSNGQGISFPSLQRRTLYGYEAVPVENQGFGGDLYEISGLPQGKYKVRMNVPGQPARTSELSLTTDGQELDPTAGELSGNLKVALALTDGSKLPQGSGVMLLDSSRAIVAGRSLNEKGEASFEELDPGEYTFAVRGPGRAYTVSRVVGDGIEAAGYRVKIASGSTGTVSLLVATGMGQVKGFVKRDGMAAPGAMVVLVPMDPESDPENFRRDQSDLDGSFDLQNVVPGDYKIIAIEDGWELEWSKPNVISHYLMRAQSVTVTNNEGRAMTLGSPVSLQTR